MNFSRLIAGRATRSLRPRKEGLLTQYRYQGKRKSRRFFPMTSFEDSERDRRYAMRYGSFSRGYRSLLPGLHSVLRSTGLT